MGLPAVPKEILEPGRGKLPSTSDLKLNAKKLDEHWAFGRKAYEMETGESSRKAAVPGGGVPARAFLGEGRGFPTITLRNR